MESSETSNSMFYPGIENNGNYGLIKKKVHGLQCIDEPLEIIGNWNSELGKVV